MHQTQNKRANCNGSGDEPRILASHVRAQVQITRAHAELEIVSSEQVEFLRMVGAIKNLELLRKLVLVLPFAHPSIGGTTHLVLGRILLVIRNRF